MSFEDAVAELGASIESDVSGDAPAPMAPAPAEQAAPSTTPEGQNEPQVQPQYNRDDAGRFARPAEPAATDTFDGGKFDPDTLAPELQEGWKQLQAAFTQKTQEVAAQRKQLEQFGDLNQVAQAVQLMHTLQDPQALTQFHSELTAHLQAQGLTPVQASAEAARQIEDAQAPAAAPDADRLREEFPELAPFLENQQRLEQRLSQFEAQAQQQQEAQELAYTQMALAGELQRQEMAIRESNPTYKDEDLDAIYELSSFYDGNLLTAQQRYEQIVSSRISAYLSDKQSASETSGLGPAAGAGLPSEQPVAPQTLEEAQRAAMRYLGEAGIDTLV